MHGNTLLPYFKSNKKLQNKNIGIPLYYYCNTHINGFITPFNGTVCKHTYELVHCSLAYQFSALIN